jgi:hypothetical protein
MTPSALTRTVTTRPKSATAWTTHPPPFSEMARALTWQLESIFGGAQSLTMREGIDNFQTKDGTWCRPKATGGSARAADGASAICTKSPERRQYPWRANDVEQPRWSAGAVDTSCGDRVIGSYGSGAHEWNNYAELAVNQVQRPRRVGAPTAWPHPTRGRPTAWPAGQVAAASCVLAARHESPAQLDAAHGPRLKLRATPSALRRSARSC